MKRIVLLATFLILFLLPLASHSAASPLSRGASGAEVRALQDKLVSRGYLPADKATGYFGELTESALKKFQCAQAIVCSGGASTGYGVYGPRTRAALERPALEFSGWLPHWRPVTSTIDVIPHLKDLTSVMPFAYMVKSDGTLVDALNISKEPWPSFIAEAKKNKVRVVPSILWGDAEAMHKILSNTKTRIALEDEIAALVKKNNFDGIDIDFEGKKHETIDYFSTFLKGLYQRMGKKWVYCTIEARMPLDHRYLPGTPVPPDALDYSNDYAQLNKYCDRVEIMAYDQSRVDKLLNSVRETPYAPVSDTAWAETVVTLASKSITKNKLILGVPTYGYEYEVTKMPDGSYEYDRLWPFNYRYATDIASKLGIVPGRNSAGELGFTYDPGVLAAIAPTGSNSTQTQQAVPTSSVAETANAQVSTGKPFNFVSWSDASAITEKVALARKLGIRGVAVFKFDGGEDQWMWDALKN